MNQKEKGRADCHQATLNTSYIKCHFTSFSDHLKTVVSTLATWGWFPIVLAEWITQQGEQDDE